MSRSLLMHLRPVVVVLFCNCNVLIQGLLSTSKCNMRLHGHRHASKLNLFENIFDQQQKKQQWPKVEVPSDFVIPEPQPLTITESTDLVGFATASAGLALRLATGAFVLGWQIDSIFAEDDGKYALQLGPLRIRDFSSVLDESNQPVQTIVLYDNESSPARCKRVREMFNLLDITYECRPAFDNLDSLPYIYDPNMKDDQQTIKGDDSIIDHLLDNYGPSTTLYDTKALWPISFRQFAIVTSTLAALLRGNPGKTQQANARPDNADMKPIELWAYECSPFVRPVKEKLYSLGLPHRVVSCSRGSSNRDKMVEKTGRFQVPYLVDDNTGIEMFESAEIVKYLEATYTV